MNKIDSSIRLTDAMEREFLMKAVEEQLRFRPLEALRSLLSRLFASKARRQASNTFAGELKTTH